MIESPSRITEHSCFEPANLCDIYFSSRCNLLLIIITRRIPTRVGEVDTHGMTEKEDMNDNRITWKLEDTRAIGDETHKQSSLASRQTTKSKQKINKKTNKTKKTTNEKNNDSTSKKGPRQEGQRVNEL